MDTILCLALAAVSGQVVAMAPLPATLALFAVLLLLVPFVPWRALVVCVVVFGLSGIRAQGALEAFEVERVRVRDALGPPERCAGSGRVVVSPVWGGDALAFVAEMGTLDCDGRKVEGPLRVRLHGGPKQLARGDRFEAVAQLAPLQLFRNLDARDPLPGAVRRGITLSGSTLSLDVTSRGGGLAAAVDRLRAHARERILATFAPGAQGMARALVLGENDLDPEDDAAFRRSGLSHMLAVSGTHLVFAVAALVGALGALLVRWEWLAVRIDVNRVASFAGIPLALAYADFAGGSGSAWRAAWMLAAGFLARAVNRAPRPTRSLALSLLVGAAVDPLVAFDISFLLSAAATTGLLVIGPSFARHTERLPSRVARFVGGSVAATLSSMLPCAPLLALLAPELTFAGVLANVLAAPFGETIALPLCLSHVLLAPLPWLEHGVALVASGALLVVKQIAWESAAATALAFGVPAPNAWQLALLAVGGAGLALSARRARARLFRAVWMTALAASLFVVERAQRAAGRSTGVLRISMLDVGQGDATLVEFPDGAAWLVDAGGMVGNPVDTGQAVVLPVLRAKRRTRLEVVVLTHPHPDHFGGLPAVLRGVEVGELWDSGQGEAHGAGPVYAELLALARARGIPVRRPPELCGRPRRPGGVRVELVSPCPSYVPGRDANDNSLVLHLAFGARAALLTGDAEAAAERDLVARRGADLRADLLKAGHHGSRTSTGDALLEAVRPTWTTLSSGVRNRFGHPHVPVLERLTRHGVATVRLDRSGGFTWTTDGTRETVRSAMAAR
ncbi:MAG TPA: DNA internalization-related competence protein ComEC/Rec2 [Polyangiaceae bacterium]